MRFFFYKKLQKLVLTLVGCCGEGGKKGDFFNYRDVQYCVVVVIFFKSNALIIKENLQMCF